MKIRVTTITCQACGDEIYSRARHDFHYCKCGETFVDGGFDYLRYGYSSRFLRPEPRQRYVTATRRELYDDWNTRINRFGVVVKKGAK
jgi:hypothetical protein